MADISKKKNKQTIFCFQVIMILKEKNKSYTLYLISACTSNLCLTQPLVVFS